MNFSFDFKETKKDLGGQKPRTAPKGKNGSAPFTEAVTELQPVHEKGPVIKLDSNDKWHDKIRQNRLKRTKTSGAEPGTAGSQPGAGGSGNQSQPSTGNQAGNKAGTAAGQDLDAERAVKSDSLAGSLANSLDNNLAASQGSGPGLTAGSQLEQTGAQDPTAESYDDLSVEDFGAAILRGLGSSPGADQQPKPARAVGMAPRPAGAGIGSGASSAAASSARRTGGLQIPVKRGAKRARQGDSN